MSRRRADVQAWLDRNPSLPELQAAYPADWTAVERDLTDVVDRGDLEHLKTYAVDVAEGRRYRPARRGTQREAEAITTAQVRQAMAAAALKQLCLRAATGVTEGRVRFNLVNGWVAQRLLFARGLERKPASLAWFRALWPLLTQRRFLMPLVEPKGIYCFYSRRLVKAIAELAGERSCLEIAAGDGTLSRFLAAEGAEIVATDDRSWAPSGVEYPDMVLDQDARTALRAHEPQVVICSWPPAGNPFERDVFATPSVELYVVIGSRHRFASGNWAAYEQQTAFTLTERPDLGRMVLPPEIEPAVHVFERKPA